jgi:hypothetical protein
VPANTNETAIGFRVKSGRAIAVLLASPGGRPQVLDRREISLCDPSIPESRQPYHAGMGMHETDETKISLRREVVARATSRSVTELMRDYLQAGHTIRSAGLVVGSETDPARITNPHIRAHALEGRLFRTVLEDALRSSGLTCSILVERDAYVRAAAALNRPEHELRRLVAQLGRGLRGPWRSDEKTAALAGWLALA